MRSSTGLVLAGFFGAAASAAFVPAAPCHAAALNPKQVASKAIFVIHVDVDALARSRLWKDMHQQILHSPRVGRGIRKLDHAMGMQFPQDFHDITAYGSGYKPADMVFIMHAKTDEQTVVDSLKGKPKYSSVAYGKYKLRTWTENGRSMWGSYQNASTIVVGHAKTAVEHALDVLGGKKASLSESSPLLHGQKPGTVLYLSGMHLARLHKAHTARSPVMQELKSAWMSIATSGNSVVMRAVVHAVTAEAASHISKYLNGMRGMVRMAGGQNGTGQEKQRAHIIKTMQITAAGKTVRVRWPIPLKLIEKAAHHGQGQPGGGNQ